MLQEGRIEDYWNVDGDRNLSEPWTCFTQFTILNEKPPDRQTWSGKRLTKMQATTRPDHLFMARNLVRDVESNSAKGEAAMGHRETEARQCKKLEMHLLYRSGEEKVQTKPQKRTKNWKFRWNASRNRWRTQ